jgi:hypothetical protein
VKSLKIFWVSIFIPIFVQISIRVAALAVASFFVCSTLSQAQTAASAAAPGETANAVHDLQDQVRELRSLVEEMRAENAESRAEMHQLRHDLESTRALLEHPPTPVNANSITVATAASPQNPSGTTSTATPAGSSPIEERVQKLEDSSSLLGSKIDEQYQTKVESASKYRARLHGIVLMNAFRNVGGSDNLDFPSYSEPVAPGAPEAALGATMRQSEIGLEVFGPTIGGARTSADVQLDFAGGFPATGNGVNFGIVRLQTADVRFDWENTSIVAGQDALFISPLSPHFVCITGHARLRIRRKSLGLDAATARRASLLHFPPANRNRAGGNSRQPRLGVSQRFVLPVRAGRGKCPASPLTRCAPPGRVRCGIIRLPSASPVTMAARTGLGAVSSTLTLEWPTGKFRLFRVWVSPASFTVAAALADWAARSELPSCMAATRMLAPLQSAASTPPADGLNSNST